MLAVALFPAVKKVALATVSRPTVFALQLIADNFKKKLTRVGCEWMRRSTVTPRRR